MRTPRLSRRLVLEAPARSPDGAGGFTTAWSALGTLWADIAPGPARVADRPGAAEHRLPLRITLRGAPLGAPSRPVPGQRLREGARLYAVQSVAEADPEGRYLVCVAHEETAL